MPGAGAGSGPRESPKTKAVSKATGTKAILVVEDEEPVREIARVILERAGYPVLTATSGANAIEVFAASSGEIRIPFHSFSLTRGSYCVVWLASGTNPLQESSSMIDREINNPRSVLGTDLPGTGRWRMSA